MAYVSCPKCGESAQMGVVPAWEIIVAICFFPVGLLALLCGRTPTVCPKCDFRWNA